MQFKQGIASNIDATKSSIEGQTKRNGVTEENLHIVLRQSQTYQSSCSIDKLNSGHLSMLVAEVGLAAEQFAARLAAVAVVNAVAERVVVAVVVIVAEGVVVVVVVVVVVIVVVVVVVVAVVELVEFVVVEPAVVVVVVVEAVIVVVAAVEAAIAGPVG